MTEPQKYRLIFAVVAIALILLMALLLFLDKLGGAILVFLSAFGFLFFGHLDTIKTFRVSQSGIAAETRDIVQEARDTIAEVKLLAIEFAKFAVIMISGDGRMGGGMSLEQKEQAKEQIIETLRALNVAEQSVAAVLDSEYRYVCFDYPFYITRRLGRGLDNAGMLQWNEFFSSDKRRGIGYEPTPEELEEFLGAVGLLTPLRSELIEDYRYYREHHRHRRPEIWIQREHWND